MSTQGVGDAWVGNELRVIAREGIPFVLHALNRPKATYFKSADVDAMNAGTRFLYPLPRLGSVRAGLLAPLRYRQRFFGALWNALTGERESLRVRAAGIWHLYTACSWAESLQNERVSHIHSQWIHSGGTVAMYGAWLLGKSFSFTGHAADLFRERAALRDKIQRADFVICISSFHRDFFLKNGARPEQLHIAFCGIDPSVFKPRPPRTPDGVFRIRSSGRLVEKKGFTYLLQACRLLGERGLDYECTIAGSGPLEASLRQEIKDLGLESRVTLTGTALKQEDIPDFMYGGDAYCLPCVWAADDDVDGLPQMLMEAMACGLPAVSTRLVGIPDLVVHERTGLLVEPREAGPLADALERLYRDRELSRRLADEGRKHVLEHFDLKTCLSALIEQYRARLRATS
jgi:glycosyltransferase involved in cell wall biosynthesis